MQGKAANKQAMPGIGSVHQKYAKPAKFGRYIRKAHKRVVRFLGYARTMRSDSGWLAYAGFLECHLDRYERAENAAAAMAACDPEDYLHIAETFLKKHREANDPLSSDAFRDAAAEYRAQRRRRAA